MNYRQGDNSRYNIDMLPRRDHIFVIIIILITLILVTFPYVIANRCWGNNFIFSGFLLNPQDGNSYLAKMYQGWRGEWRFTLPFTPDPGKGAFLFLFYLGLGHIARYLQLPTLLVFHFTRIAGCLFLLWSLWRFMGVFFDRGNTRKLAFALSSLGSGMGWLFLPTGAFTSDFWVAETFPFLSSYANPHFTIGLALVLWLVTLHTTKTKRTTRWLFTGIGALSLSFLNPFGVVVTLVILGGQFIWNLFERSISRDLFIQAVIIGCCGLPLLVYDLWIANTDPAFIAWNNQNLTQSPPVWDLLISLSPAFVFVALGLIKTRKDLRSKTFSRMRILMIWAFLGLLLVYAPVGLQRRFMMGLYVPIAGLAAFGIESLAGNQMRRFRLLSSCLFILSIPTNLIILLSAQPGIIVHDPNIYLTRSEFEAFSWIEDHTQPHALILSAPETGLFIPAHTGRRVIYGHPYETINAPTQEVLSNSFFQGKMSPFEMWALVEEMGVEYIFYGPRESRLGDIQPFLDWQPVFTYGEVSVFQISEEVSP